MDNNQFSGLDINTLAVIIAQLLSTELKSSEMNLLASFLYTVSDCLNTIAMTQNNNG